jgi:hypothetical protein
MSFIKAIGVIVLCYIGYIVAIDLIAVLLVTILPEPGDRRLNGSAGFGSLALYYAVWLVAGCLAGAFFIMQSLERTKGNVLIQQRPLLIVLTALLLSAGLILFFYLLGEMPDPRVTYSNSYYVPGNRSMTWTFFISFLLVSFLFRNMEKK